MSTPSKRDLLKKEQNLTQNTNPAKKFYKWESDNKTFSWYNKETKENVLTKLPFEFVTLGKPLITVKGFNEKLNKGIFSNEVQTVNDELTVRYFDKNIDPIAIGKWNDIKDTVDAKGAKFHLSIYGYDLKTKEIINISIKGMGVGEWYELQKSWSHRLADEIVQVKSYKEGKTGKNEYTYPAFNLLRSITDEELDVVFDALANLKTFLKEYLSKSGNELKEDINDVEEEPEDDLEF
jgi:hypothetical protein